MDEGDNCGYNDGVVYLGTIYDVEKWSSFEAARIQTMCYLIVKI